ncbi:D-alanyl-D-alanine carboxypeptidase family protein [Puerhibacterium sp. TATVAM-FAB25]|uniref:M15 family metallopeptidase n=1 Tax=Puerhibacterium sp. TATVAM-FAB25 TaxID=3093699 RepID=UPI0039797A0F
MTVTNPTRSSLRRERDARRARLRRSGGATLATVALAATLVTANLTTAAAAPAQDAAPAASATTPATPTAPVPQATPEALAKAGQVLGRADFVVRESAASRAQRSQIAKATAQLRKLVDGSTSAAPAATSPADAAVEQRGAVASRAGERAATTAAASAPQTRGGGTATGGHLAASATVAAVPALADLAGPTLTPAQAAPGGTTSLAKSLPKALSKTLSKGTTANAAAAAPAAPARAAEPRALGAKTAAELAKTTKALESLLQKTTAAAAVDVTPRPVPKPKPKPKAVDRPEAADQQAAKTKVDKSRAEKAARLAAGARNGYVPVEALCDLSFASGERLRCDATEALERLDEAYRARFGTHLTINDTYRSFEAQVATKAARGFWAAKPGYSNHGWGVAVDLGGGIQERSSAQHAWMVENAGRFGWRNPEWAQADGRKPEAWHWEFGTRD